jgi:glycosyltransferase involved in cell wall biosynthesis
VDDLAVMLITYNRPVEIRQTIQGLLKWAYGVDLRTAHWHICDDGSPGDYVEEIKRDFPDLYWTSTITQREGWGANANAGLKALKEDFIFLCEDDYEAERRIYLGEGLKILSECTDIGLIRYGGIWMHLGPEYRVTDGDNYYKFSYKNAPLNLYSNQPHLCHRRFIDAYGFYPEGFSLAETELRYADSVKEQIKSKHIVSAALKRDKLSCFKHIGKTHQHTSDDLFVCKERHVDDFAVMVITYNRPEEIRKTINGLIKWARGVDIRSVHWHICDDGSPGDYIEDLKREYIQLNMTFTITQRAGWGANANTGLRFLREPFIFLCEDDYEATRPLNFKEGTDLLRELPELGIVRYDGVWDHELDLHLRSVMLDGERIPYLKVGFESPHLNIYSNHPHLRHKRFTETYGYYPEGRSLAETEISFSELVKERGPERNVGVAILQDGIEQHFTHLCKDKSWQHTAEDIYEAKET